MGVFYTTVSGNGNVPRLSSNRMEAPAGDGTTGKELEDRFMKLLVAQMHNQDPTNPMDNSQLTAQLAQISTLAGIEKLNTTIGQMTGRIDRNIAVNASKLIGKSIMVPGDTITVQTLSDEKTKIDAKEGINERVSSLVTLADKKSDERITTPFGFELDRDADSVIITIVDNNGKLIREIDLGSVPAGVNTFIWDGKNSDATQVADGRYKFTVNAKSEERKVPTTPLAYSHVYGVIQGKSTKGVLLDLGLVGTVSIDEVRQIL